MELEKTENVGRGTLLQSSSFADFIKSASRLSPTDKTGIIQSITDLRVSRQRLDKELI